MSIKNKLKTFFAGDDEYEYEYVEAPGEIDVPGQAPTFKRKNTNVVNLTSIEQPTSKVVLSEPRTYNEAQEIADNIVNRRAVVINLQRLDNMEAKRVVDFLSGTVYAVNGSMQKLDSRTFLCTPDNVSVSGSITETLIDDETFEKGWS